MRIQLICDWCGKVMKTVSSFEKVRDAQQMGENTCSTCNKKVEKIDRYLANIKNSYESRVDVLIKELKEDFKAGLQKGDFDGGANIQNVGSEDKTPRRQPK